MMCQQLQVTETKQHLVSELPMTYRGQISVVHKTFAPGLKSIYPQLQDCTMQNLNSKRMHIYINIRSLLISCIWDVILPQHTEVALQKQTLHVPWML